MQLLPILENLDSDMLLNLVIKAPEHDPKSTSSQLFLHLIPIEQLILCLI